MQAHYACANGLRRKTLTEVFTDPVSGTIAWNAVEASPIAAGCVVVEGTGSRVRFAFGPEGEHVETFHRPHPEEAKRHQIKAARALLTKIGVTPGGTTRERGRIERMSNALRYKGYAARVAFDADHHLFVGTIAGISDGVGFHADTVADLEAAFREAVDDYVETCAKVGKAPQRRYSGSLQFRVSPELHANVALAAELSSKSLNQWGEEVLRRAAEAAAA